MIRPRTLAALALAGLTLTACSQEGTTSSGSPEASDAATCTKESLQTRTPGILTIATGEPAYEPWVKNDAPESGEGFEAAVAHAAAEKLGFAKEDVQWVRTTFDGAIAPGPKDFDWNLQQFSITEDREKAVDFSSPYYDLNQAIVSSPGSAIEGVTSVADLQGSKLGAAVGTTSLEAAQAVTDEVSVFNDNAAAVAALKNGQIDGIVVDVPTADYLVNVEVEGGVIVGQLPPATGGQTDQLAILLANNSPLTACTTQAVDALRADGTLDQLVDTWLDAYTSVPTLQ
jgi:polar amino acid transport system substrate-binding protein